MRFLRRLQGVSLRDRVRNELGLESSIVQYQNNCKQHVNRMSSEASFILQPKEKTGYRTAKDQMEGSISINQYLWCRNGVIPNSWKGGGGRGRGRRRRRSSVEQYP